VHAYVFGIDHCCFCFTHCTLLDTINAARMAHAPASLRATVDRAVLLALGTRRRCTLGSEPAAAEAEAAEDEEEEVPLSLLPAPSLSREMRVRYSSSFAQSTSVSVSNFDPPPAIVPPPAAAAAAGTEEAPAVTNIRKKRHSTIRRRFLHVRTITLTLTLTLTRISFAVTGNKVNAWQTPSVRVAFGLKACENLECIIDKTVFLFSIDIFFAPRGSIATRQGLRDDTRQACGHSEWYRAVRAS